MQPAGGVDRVQRRRQQDDEDEPHLPAITWAVALAIIAWPVHAWLGRRIARPWLSAGLTSFLVVAAVLVPLLFVGYQLVREAASVAERVQDNTSEGGIRETMVQQPFLRDVVGWLERFGVDVDQEVRRIVASYTRDPGDVTQGSLAAGLQTLMAVFILYHLFRSRAALMRGCGGCSLDRRRKAIKSFPAPPTPCTRTSTPTPSQA